MNCLCTVPLIVTVTLVCMLSNLMFGGFFVLGAEDLAVYFRSSQDGIKYVIPYPIYISNSLVPLVTASHWDLDSAALDSPPPQKSYSFLEGNFVLLKHGLCALFLNVSH